MKVTLLAAGLVATVFAQDLFKIPECARTCLTDAIAQDGHCQATDAACVCGRIDALTSLATGCVLSACGQEVALNQVLPAVQTLCANVGPGSSAPASTSAAPTSAAEPSSAASSPASASSSRSETTASVTESSSGPATMSASHSTMTHPSNATGGSSPTATNASATSSVVTAGAAQYGSVGGLAAFMLGAVAIF